MRWHVLRPKIRTYELHSMLACSRDSHHVYPSQAAEALLTAKSVSTTLSNTNQKSH